MLEVNFVNLKVTTSKTETIAVVNHSNLKHSAIAKQQEKVNPKSAVSQTDVVELQQKSFATKCTDAIKAQFIANLLQNCRQKFAE